MAIKTVLHPFITHADGGEAGQLMTLSTLASLDDGPIPVPLL